MRSYHKARKAYQAETEEEFTAKILADMQKVQLLTRLPTIKRKTSKVPSLKYLTYHHF